MNKRNETFLVIHSYQNLVFRKMPNLHIAKRSGIFPVGNTEEEKYLKSHINVNFVVIY